MMDDKTGSIIFLILSLTFLYLNRSGKLTAFKNAVGGTPIQTTTPIITGKPVTSVPVDPFGTPGIAVVK